MLPEIATDVPTGPLFGDKPVIDVEGFTVKGRPLLAPPGLVVTTTFPVVAPAGTTTEIDVELQLAMLVAMVPLKLTVLFPCVAPKFVPTIVSCDPAGPEFGVSVTRVAGTAKDTPLLLPADVLTTTVPEEAPAGTTATMTDDVQLLTAATVPLNVTVPVPCVAPKLDPLIVTSDPALPWVGVSDEIDGVCGQVAGPHGAGVWLSVESDEPRAAMSTAAATPPPTPMAIGTVLLPDFAAAGAGCGVVSVGRFVGRCAGGG